MSSVKAILVLAFAAVAVPALAQTPDILTVPLPVPSVYATAPPTRLQPPPPHRPAVAETKAKPKAQTKTPTD
jgi:hypothetical protein